MERDIQEDVNEIVYRAEAGTVGIPARPFPPPAGTAEDRVAILEMKVAAQKEAILLLAAKLGELRGS